MNVCSVLAKQQRLFGCDHLLGGYLPHYRTRPRPSVILLLIYLSILSFSIKTGGANMKPSSGSMLRLGSTEIKQFHFLVLRSSL